MWAETRLGVPPISQQAARLSAEFESLGARGQRLAVAAGPWLPYRPFAAGLRPVCEDPLADSLGDLFGCWGRGEGHGTRLQSHKSSYKFFP